MHLSRYFVDREKKIEGIRVAFANIQSIHLANQSQREDAQTACSVARRGPFAQAASYRRPRASLDRLPLLLLLSQHRISTQYTHTHISAQDSGHPTLLAPSTSTCSHDSAILPCLPQQQAQYSLESFRCAGSALQYACRSLRFRPSTLDDIVCETPIARPPTARNSRSRPYSRGSHTIRRQYSSSRLLNSLGRPARRQCHPTASRIYYARAFRVSDAIER